MGQKGQEGPDKETETREEAFVRDREYEGGDEGGNGDRKRGLLNVDLCAFPVYGRYCAGGTRNTIGSGLRIQGVYPKLN